MTHRQHTITVDSTGAAAVVPDAVQVSISVDYRGQDVAVVLADLARGSEQALSVFRDSGVPESSIASERITVGNAWNGPDTEMSYEASQGFQVRLARMTQLGEILPALADGVGNALRVHSMGPVATDSQAAVREARAAAFEGAREQAGQLAALAGRELGRVIEMSATRGGHHAPMTRMAAMGMEADSAIPMASGEREVTVDLQVTWELVDAE